MHLKSSLILQADAYQTFGHKTYLRIYVLCIHPSYKSRGVGNALLKAHSLLALNMQVFLEFSIDSTTTDLFQYSFFL